MSAKLDLELGEVVEVLAADGALPPRFNDRPLTGNWKDHRDCHVNPDLVLIYRKCEPDVLTLVRFGSHSALF
jgi:mRNA interferase YafQ